MVQFLFFEEHIMGLSGGLQLATMQIMKKLYLDVKACNINLAIGDSGNDHRYELRSEMVYIN